MNVNSINSTNFTAKVEKSFVNSARNFYLRRAMPDHLKRFNNKLDAMETYGDEFSEIVYSKIGTEHFLCLKNLNFNNKKATIIKQSTYFPDILKKFCDLNDAVIQQYEAYLKMIKK